MTIQAQKASQGKTARHRRVGTPSVLDLRDSQPPLRLFAPSVCRDDELAATLQSVLRGIGPFA